MTSTTVQGRSDAARPIKVLFAIGTLDVGGAERQLVELAGRLDRARFAPVVCVLGNEGPLAAPLRARGVPLHFLGFHGLRSGSRLRVLSACGALARLWRIMRRERPAIFHGFLFSAYVAGTLAARAARVPFVIASRRSLGLFKAGKPHYLAVERLTNRLTDLFIANSEAVRQDAVAQEKLAPERVIVIYNGVDCDSTGPAPSASIARELALRRPAVTVVSNFIEYKGHEFFFPAWRTVSARYPGAVALMVGEGPTRARWERWCAAEGLADSVRFLGSRDDVRGILGASDLFVHPSLQEGYSNAVLEAMAASLPIVATAVGGNVEAIEHERTGLLVAPADADALAAAMTRLLADPPLARRLGDAARAVVERRHQLSDMVRAYEEVYERLAASGAGHGNSVHVRNRRSV